MTWHTGKSIIPKILVNIAGPRQVGVQSRVNPGMGEVANPKHQNRSLKSIRLPKTFPPPGGV